MIRELRPTISLGVPTIWNDVLRVAETDPERRPVEPARHPRGRRGGPALHDRAVPRSLRHRSDSRLGHDRDQSARGGVDPARGHAQGARGRLPRKGGTSRRGRRASRRRRRRHRAAARRQVRRGVRDPRTLDHRFLLWRGRSRQVPRRLAAHRGYRHARRRRLHGRERPNEGRHQVRRRVD